MGGHHLVLELAAAGRHSALLERRVQAAHLGIQRSQALVQLLNFVGLAVQLLLPRGGSGKNLSFAFSSKFSQSSSPHAWMPAPAGTEPEAAAPGR